MMADARHTAGMRRALALPFLAASAVGVLGTAPAGAATVSCTYGTYFPGSEDSEPVVTELRARNLPRRTSDYAPPCLLAETVAGIVQLEASEGMRPTRVKAMGARWYGGVYRCTYAGTAATCRKAGKPRRRVTFSLGA